jgi:hypothetical protein
MSDRKGSTRTPQQKTGGEDIHTSQHRISTQGISTGRRESSHLRQHLDSTEDRRTKDDLRAMEQRLDHINRSIWQLPEEVPMRSVYVSSQAKSHHQPIDAISQVRMCVTTASAHIPSQYFYATSTPLPPSAPNPAYAMMQPTTPILVTREPIVNPCSINDTAFNLKAFSGIINKDDEAEK